MYIILGIFFVQVAFGCINFKDCKSCAASDNCFWLQKTWNSRYTCESSLENYFTIATNCDKNISTAWLHIRNDFVQHDIDLPDEKQNKEVKVSSISNTTMDYVERKTGQSFRIPNSTLITSRFKRRIQRNQCHYLNFLMKLQKMLNVTSYNKIIKNNMMFRKEKICMELINEKRVEHLLTIKFPTASTLLQSGCEGISSCKICTETCFWVTSESESWCTSTEPTESNVTFIPPLGHLWCEPTPDASSTSDGYKIAFWTLIVVVTIAGITAVIYKKKKMTVRGEEIPLNIL